MSTDERDANSAGKMRILQTFITDEIYLALGLPPHVWWRGLLDPLFGTATRRFSQFAAGFDAIVAGEGFHAAVRWALPRFIREVLVLGERPACPTGPLIVASNHPGTVDALAIADQLARDDLAIIATGIPFLRGLPHLADHLIYATPDPHQRMAAVRQAIRHLEAGGALLLYPSMGIDPDPAHMPGAGEALGRWSRSLEIFLQRVPPTRVMVTIASHVLDPRFTRSPLTRLRKARMDRQRIAEFMQVIYQMLAPGKLLVSPRLSFDQPVTIEQLMDSARSMEIRSALIDRARALLEYHLTQIGGVMGRG